MPSFVLIVLVLSVPVVVLLVVLLGHKVLDVHDILVDTVLVVMLSVPVVVLVVVLLGHKVLDVHDTLVDTVFVVMLSVRVVVLLVVLLGHKVLDVHDTLVVPVLVVILLVPMIASSPSSNLLVVVQLSLRAPKFPVTSINNPLVDMVVRLVFETFMVEPPSSWNCNFGTQTFKDKATKWKKYMESCMQHVKIV